MEREDEQSAEDSCMFLASERLKEALQLTLQQQRGFELCRFTYTGYFPVVDTTILHSLWLIESLDMEVPWNQSQLRIIYGLTAALFNGQLYIGMDCLCRLFIEIVSQM